MPMLTASPDTQNVTAGGAFAVERVVRREIARIRLMSDISEGMTAPAPTKVLEMALDEIERLRTLFAGIANLESGRDGNGSLGPKPPISHESVALVAFDCACEALTPNGQS